MLLSGIPRGAVKPAEAQRARRLARLSEDAFRELIEGRDVVVKRHGPPAPCPGMVMVQTEWSVYRHGVMHRQAYAVDDPAAAGLQR